jgi:hypothetical protein
MPTTLPEPAGFVHGDYAFGFPHGRISFVNHL